MGFFIQTMSQSFEVAIGLSLCEELCSVLGHSVLKLLAKLFVYISRHCTGLILHVILCLMIRLTHIDSEEPFQMKVIVNSGCT